MRSNAISVRAARYSIALPIWAAVIGWPENDNSRRINSRIGRRPRPVSAAAGISGKLSVLSRGSGTGRSFAEQCQRRLKSFLPGFNQLGFFGLLFAQGECRLSVGFQAGQVRASALK